MAEKLVQTQLNSQDILRLDGYLKPFLPAIERRYKQFQQWKNAIFEHEGGYEKFTKGYEVMGFSVMEDGTVVYREWAPNAQEANLIGDFSLSKFSAWAHVSCWNTLQIDGTGCLIR
jgi:1,4-alpha-glucan branching enzyme